MSVMDPFFTHVEACSQCQRQRDPCPVGERLLKEGTERLTKKMLANPDRVKA